VTKPNIKLNANNTIEAKIEVLNTGIPASLKYYYEKKPLNEMKKEQAENKFSSLSNSKINKLTYQSEKQKLEFKEQYDLTAENLLEVAGDYLLLPVRFLSLEIPKLKKSKKRKYPIVFPREYKRESLATYHLPEGYNSISEFENFTLDNAYFEYTLNVSFEGRQIKVHRNFLLRKGHYEPKLYNKIRTALDKIRVQEKKLITIRK